MGRGLEVGGAGFGGGVGRGLEVGWGGVWR